MVNDRNTYIGLFLIGAVLFGWMYFNQPSKEQLAKEKARQDSVVLAHHKDSLAKVEAAKHPVAATAQHPVATTDSARKADSVANANKVISDYGIFYPALKGDFRYSVLSNDLMQITIANKGGKIASVQLTKFKTSSGNPLVLFFPDSSHFGVRLTAYAKYLSTDTLYFTAKHMTYATNGDSGSITMRLNTSDSTKYIEYTYSVKKGSYMVGCSIHTVGLQNVLANNIQDLPLEWSMNIPSQEANMQTQQQRSNIYYKYAGDEIDYMNAMKDDKKPLSNDLSWVAFKQQYFTSVLIADTRFGRPEVAQITNKNPWEHNIKTYSAELSVPYNHQPDESFGMKFYYGPNDYHILKSYNTDANDLQLERQINLGWGIFGWVNRYVVLFIFNFLNQFNLNYGIVILILTIVIKAVLFPIAFRTYKSSAKMRLLKPELDEINARYPKTEDSMKKQQAVMALYKKAGASPMAGCLPMLLQLPILYALFSFFPASIELRQQGFLWAHDLSTYDTAISFHNFKLPFLGDHISIFALLMTASQYLYLSVNQQSMGAPGTDQMGKTMKWMMYIMPIIFLGVLNNYSAGLSYYYFLANLITFGQTYLARLFIDEAELHRKMQENKAKVVKPSKFQQRLAEMVKEQQAKQKGR
jgi:YidC/Oxa1 family membrane protein insertase